MTFLMQYKGKGKEVHLTGRMTGQTLFILKKTKGQGTKSRRKNLLVPSICAFCPVPKFQFSLPPVALRCQNTQIGGYFRGQTNLTKFYFWHGASYQSPDAKSRKKSGVMDPSFALKGQIFSDFGILPKIQENQAVFVENIRP